MKNKFIIALLTAGIGLIALAPVVGADQDVDLHCPDGGVKVEVNDDNDDTSDDQDVVNALVLEEGTLVCVKAGPGNTDIVEADGEMTLQEILFEAGIVDGSGEQGRDVSYYVVYEERPTTTTTAPTTTTTERRLELTPTTVPEVTTTTVAQVTVTTVPVTAAPVALAAPTAVAQPLAELPRTGSFAGWLAVIGGLIGLAGLTLLAISARMHNRRNEIV